MESNRKTAIIVGTLFLIATFVIILSGFFTSSISEPDYLTAISANENQVILGALLEIISTTAIVGIPIAMFPILKKYNASLALGYVGARIFEGLTIFLNTILLLALLSLSKEFMSIGAVDVAFYQNTGDLLLAVRNWGSILLNFPFCLSVLIFNYLLYKSVLIPRWLSGWGFIGGALLLGATLLGLFNLTPAWLYFAAPIAVQEMVLALWLIVKGFNISEIAS